MSKNADTKGPSGAYSLRVYCAIIVLCIAVAVLHWLQQAVFVHVFGDVPSDGLRDGGSWRPMAASVFMSCTVDLLLYGGVAALLVATRRLPHRTATSFAVGVTVMNQLIMFAIEPLVRLVGSTGDYSNLLGDALLLAIHASRPLFILALGALAGAFAAPRSVTALYGFVFAEIVLMPYLVPAALGTIAVWFPTASNVLFAFGFTTFNVYILSSLVSAGLCLALFAPMREGRLIEDASTTRL